MKRKLKHYKGRTRHHLIPKIRGGKNGDDNLLLLYAEKHEHWHKIFGNRTLEEIILVLMRIQRMKSRKEERKMIIQCIVCLKIYACYPFKYIGNSKTSSERWDCDTCGKVACLLGNNILPPQHHNIEISSGYCKTCFFNSSRKHKLT